VAIVAIEAGRRSPQLIPAPHIWSGYERQRDESAFLWRRELPPTPGP